MNKSTVMTIIRYSVVIMLLALCMFFWVDVSAPSFAAVCITMVFCFASFFFGVLWLLRDEESSLGKKRVAIILGVYVAVCAVAVAVKCLLI